MNLTLRTKMIDQMSFTETVGELLPETWYQQHLPLLLEMTFRLAAKMQENKNSYNSRKYWYFRSIHQIVVV